MTIAGDDWVWLPTAPPSLQQFLTVNLQPVPVIPLLAAILAMTYLLGVLRLRHAGRGWPWGRTACFLAGCALIAVVMGAGLEGYGYVLFSVFMFQQLTLMLVIPPLLVLGSPGTLLLRATPHRGVGRLILRAALSALRSRTARFLLHPGFMIPLFLFTFYGIYLTGIADRILGSWAGHTGLELMFLASGVLFTLPLISADPLPARQSHLGKMLDVFAEVPLHAFFGIIVMMSTQPLVRTFTDIPASWGIDPLADQKIAGGLAWAYGEGPTVALLLVLMSRWYRADTASARRADLHADRDGDAALDDYNAYLDRLQQRSPPGGQKQQQGHVQKHQ